MPSKEQWKPIQGVKVSLEVRNVQKLWEEMNPKKNVCVVFSLRENSWGDTSFCIADPEGFQLTFFTKNEQDRTGKKA